MDKDDAKSRGKQHNNKKKYNKNKPAAHIPKPRPKKPLEDNWDRYEQKEAPSIISSSTDFAILANAPITQGSHFQFKSDRDSWEIDERLQGSDLFKLDLVLLEKSLATIPFSVRSGIERQYFSENQLRFMSALTDNANAYHEYLKSHQNPEPDVIFGSKSKSSSDEDEATAPQEDPKEEKIYLQEAIPEAKNDDDDLEQWLDDILDD